MWWNPESYQRKIPFLKTRMELVKAIRNHFDNEGFLEVETPALQVSPGMEPHLHSFKTLLLNAEHDKARERHLHTSPEFAMKKLLVAGLPKIYQICHVFRNAEGSRLHSPEFSMIEWYRANANYRDIMQDCVNLLRACAKACGIDAYRQKNCASDPFQDWEIVTVCDAFRIYAGIDLEAFVPAPNAPDKTERQAFAEAIRKQGLHCAADDRWDDLFFRVFLEKIEPRLGQGRPTILYDYPVSMAALSRPGKDDPRFAERFELYVCGIELANAFGELTDAAIQRKRFEEDMALKERLYGETFPIDEDFLTALGHGMPESGGIALGVDRLAMLATGAETITDILWAEVV